MSLRGMDGVYSVLSRCARFLMADVCWRCAIAAPADRPVSARILASPPSLPLTRLIGRDAEWSAIIQILARARLVTLTGPGGTGKTRVALHVADDLRDAFADGVAFVPLAAI